MLTHAGPSTLAQPRCWRALNCGAFKHTTLKDLTLTRPPPPTPYPPGLFSSPKRGQMLMHRCTSALRNIAESWIWDEEQSNRLGSNLSPPLLVFPVGIIQNRANSFSVELSARRRRAWKCSCSSLNCLPPCNCNYSPLSMYLCILSICGPPLAARIERKSV